MSWVFADRLAQSAKMDVTWRMNLRMERHCDGEESARSISSYWTHRKVWGLYYLSWVLSVSDVKGIFPGGVYSDISGCELFWLYLMLSRNPPLPVVIPGRSVAIFRTHTCFSPTPWESSICSSLASSVSRIWIGLFNLWSMSATYQADISIETFLWRKNAGFDKSRMKELRFWIVRTET